MDGTKWIPHLALCFVLSAITSMEYLGRKHTGFQRIKKREKLELVFKVIKRRSDSYLKLSLEVLYIRDAFGYTGQASNGCPSILVCQKR